MKSLTLFCIALFFLVSCQEKKVSDRPNIVIIYADDLGYGDLGCYGHPTIKTPHLDKMAAEGMRFTQFYSGASICTPSRAALLTGRLPVRSGMSSDVWGVLFPFSTSGLPDSEITLPEVLHQAGYSTGIVGKWHLGHKREFLPLQNGFDDYFGIPYSNDMSPPNTKWIMSKIYPPIPLIDGNEIIEEEPDQRFLTKRYTERAQSFIASHRDEPFFLYFAHTFPHVPLFASPDFENKSTRGLYGDVVEELDWSVGEILKTIKASGLDEKTLVVFTSDNGPWLTQFVEGGSAGLLHQGKGCTWEGGMREPAIFRWPDKISKGAVTQALGTTMDLYVTAINLANAELPSDRKLDGIDLSDVLFNNEKGERNEILYYRGTELYAIRIGEWKLHFKTLNPYIGESPVAHDPPLLFNIENDPSEKYNLAVGNEAVIAELQKAAEIHLAGVEKAEDQLAKVDSVMLAPVRQGS